MKHFNSLYVCPEYFVLQDQDETSYESNIIPYGAIVTVSLKNINVRLYNGDMLELDVSHRHPDVESLHNEYEVKVGTACEYDSHENRSKRSYSHKKLVTLKKEIDKAHNKYIKRKVVVCRRELRNLVKQLDEYLSKLNE